MSNFFISSLFSIFPDIDINRFRIHHIINSLNRCLCCIGDLQKLVRFHIASAQNTILFHTRLSWGNWPFVKWTGQFNFSSSISSQQLESNFRMGRQIIDRIIWEKLKLLNYYQIDICGDLFTPVLILNHLSCHTHLPHFPTFYNYNIAIHIQSRPFLWNFKSTFREFHHNQILNVPLKF